MIENIRQGLGQNLQCDIHTTAEIRDQDFDLNLWTQAAGRFDAIDKMLGAAIAQVSGEVDKVFSGLDRETALAEATSIARSRALEAGADETTLTVVEVEDLPLAYLPGEARRVRVRAVGDVRPSP